MLVDTHLELMHCSASVLNKLLTKKKDFHSRAEYLSASSASKTSSVNEIKPQQQQFRSLF